MRDSLICGALGLLLAGCQATGAPPLTSAERPLAAELRFTAPAPGSGECWHQSHQPALFETVTEQRVDPQRGILSESRQREIRPRSEVWFRIPCPPEAGDAQLFHASLQRALKARGLYEGAVTGEMTPATRAAIRRYQAAQGLHSEVLSRAAALSLGLIAHSPG